MDSTSGGQIWALCAESFCERVLSEAGDVCCDGNTLLDTEEINMLVVCVTYESKIRATHA